MDTLTFEILSREISKMVELAPPSACSWAETSKSKEKLSEPNLLELQKTGLSRPSEG